jgi:hypothetical protein
VLAASSKSVILLTGTEPTAWYLRAEIESGPSQINPSPTLLL